MRRVLVIALDLAGVGVESERRGRVEVVAGPVVGDPGARIPRTPLARVRVRIIHPGYPCRRSHHTEQPHGLLDGAGTSRPGTSLCTATVGCRSWRQEL